MYRIRTKIKYVSEDTYNAPQIKSIKLLEKSARATLYWLILYEPTRL